MPRKVRTPSPAVPTHSEEEIFNHVKKALQELSVVDDSEDDEGDSLAVNKTYVCGFYKGGNHPECKFCFQPSSKILECTDTYKENIVITPAIVWSKELDEIEVREKTNTDFLENIGLKCDSCYLADNCPLMKKRSSCSINWAMGDPDPTLMLDKIITIQSERVNRARIIETMDGGVPDTTLSVEIDRLAGLLQSKADLNTNKFSMKIDMQQSGPPSKESGGVLSAIFGSMLGGKKQEALPEPEDAMVIPVRGSNNTFIEPEEVKVKRRRNSTPE